MPFKVTHPWAKFLIGGGSIDEAVDIVLVDGQKVFFTASGVWQPTTRTQRSKMEAIFFMVPDLLSGLPVELKPTSCDESAAAKLAIAPRR